MLENSDKTIFSLSKLIIKGEYIEYKFLLNLNRKFVGIELEEIYFNASVKRLKNIYND